jgi:uncharacterized protein (DUF169 family)
MNQIAYNQTAEFISNDLRLRTQPVAVRFLKEASFPEKTRRPKEHLGKRVTICQGVTMARTYGWTVGLTKEDLICVPGMIAFGLTKSSEQQATIGKLFCEVTLSKDVESGRSEANSMSMIRSGEYEGILMAPLATASFDPQTIVIYGNPAQVMRLIQAWAYISGERLVGNFGGKVECTEYLIAPYWSGTPRVSIPGNGDRIFSMTQDDEMVFALPASSASALCDGLKSAGKKIGARYPITFYQNFQPEFPKYYKTLGKELGIEEE